MTEILIETPVPITGPAKINREAVRDLRGCQVVQHGGKFRMHSNAFSVTLDPSDALWIIDELGLMANTSDDLRRVVVWSQGND